MKKFFAPAALTIILVSAGIATAQESPQPSTTPAHNVSGKRHPNLSAAQRLTDKAYEKITAAQEANEFDMDGHAQHAKDLLDQANNELKQAAIAANQNHK